MTRIQGLGLITLEGEGQEGEAESINLPAYPAASEHSQTTKGGVEDDIAERTAATVVEDLSYPMMQSSQRL